MSRFLLSSIALLGSVFTSLAAETSVLFVGNSFTHGQAEPVLHYGKDTVTDLNKTGYGGVPAIFKKLTLQAGMDYKVSSELASGQSLIWHLKNKSTNIAAGKWDVVVLQEFSTTPLPPPHGKDPAAFQKGADALEDLLLQTNPAVRIFLYETWASPTSTGTQGYGKDLQAMQTDLQKGYYFTKYRSARDAGRPDFSGVARVGDAFMKAVDEGLADPDPTDGIKDGTFDLWGTDNRHPSKYGCYLSAAIFYGKITGNDPRKLEDGPGTAAADLGIDATLAGHLQDLAFQINAAEEPQPLKK